MRFQRWSDSRAVLTTESAEETQELGAIAGCCAYPGLTVLLCGGLGMGKTQFTQGVGRALGFDRVKSPTFIIVSEHDGKLPLVHVDLYRLEESDVDSLDLDEYIYDGSLLVVEWAERWRTPPDDRWDVSFEAPDGTEGPRVITVEAVGERACIAFTALCSKLEVKQ